jgi:hypothetical protein
MVDIGRCAKCEFFKFKCASVPSALKDIWQTAFSQHHLLQIQQKRCYVAERVFAAAQTPPLELYLAAFRAWSRTSDLSGSDRVLAVRSSVVLSFSLVSKRYQHFW